MHKNYNYLTLFDSIKLIQFKIDMNPLPRFYPIRIPNSKMNVKLFWTIFLNLIIHPSLKLRHNVTHFSIFLTLSCRGSSLNDVMQEGGGFYNFCDALYEGHSKTVILAWQRSEGVRKSLNLHEVINGWPLAESN